MFFILHSLFVVIGFIVILLKYEPQEAILFCLKSADKKLTKKKKKKNEKKEFPTHQP